MSNPWELLIDDNDDRYYQTIKWATVESVSPLHIRFDGESIILSSKPDTLVNPSYLEIGSRVSVLARTGKNNLIIGLAGGEPEPEPIPLVGHYGLVTVNPNPQSFPVGVTRGILGAVERNDDFVLGYEVGNLMFFRPPQDGWYMVSGAIMKPNTNVTLIAGIAPHPPQSTNIDYLGPALYGTGANFALLQYSYPAYLYKDQEYCNKVYAGNAFTTAPNAGSSAYYSRFSVISIDSNAIGIPGERGPAGPPGPPGGGPLQISGLVPIFPTSVEKVGSGSQARLSSLGSVEFEDCNNISLNGVFSDDFDAYRIVAQLGHKGGVGNGAIYLRMRKDGVDYVTNNQISRVMYTYNSGTGGANATATAAALQIGYVATNANMKHNSFAVDLFGPHKAADTAYAGNFDSYVGGVSSGYVPGTDEFDGLTFSMFTGASSQLTGRIQVFGYIRGDFE